MTVQEAKAKEVLNNIWDFADAQDEEKGDVVDDAIIEAIGCMEELEQYRAIGLRPEQIEVMQGHNIALINDLEGYQSLGTVEELKEAREFKKYFDELYGEGLEVTNWHKNGDLEPFDSFYESALEWGEEDEP